MITILKRKEMLKRKIAFSFCVNWSQNLSFLNTLVHFDFYSAQNIVMKVIEREGLHVILQTPMDGCTPKPLMLVYANLLSVPDTMSHVIMDIAQVDTSGDLNRGKPYVTLFQILVKFTIYWIWKVW